MEQGIYQPKIIDRETYGWMEFIENKKCQKESELEEYYYKIGVMLLSYIKQDLRMKLETQKKDSGSHQVLETK